MFLQELDIENFRIFGTAKERGVVFFSKGVTAIVGGNDHGKTAVIDAIRLAIGTSDLDYIRIALSDFHLAAGAIKPEKEFKIRCKFADLNVQERGAFAEYLSYEKPEPSSGNLQPVLYINLIANNQEKQRNGRPFVTTKVKSGKSADGPTLDQNARSLLAATYLRPLRDAEREMSSGRGSRLSQILLKVENVEQMGSESYVKGSMPTDVTKLSVLDLGDYANDLLCKHSAISGAQNKINTEYLTHLSFNGDEYEGAISIGRGGSDSARLRQLLEKLELQLNSGASGEVRHGLGSNNLLFMACELLLLGDEVEASPLLLIEEPEAHLHPQRQLLLMRFLKEQADQEKGDVQVILTSHSPNIASVLPLNSLVLMQKGRAFSLAEGKTELRKEDYRFLERFLDVTKANLFFARGVVIVEGDAENILLPTLAKLLGRDFSKNGVSIVNVGSVGLGRYAKILMRKDEADGDVGVPVACVTDLDVMPDCAPVILGYVDNGIHKDNWPAKRKWKVKSDFPNNKGQTIDAYREGKSKKVSGQGVQTFVSDEWTLEYDLAFSGLAEEVYVAAYLAQRDARICVREKSLRDQLEVRARKEFGKLADDGALASEVYSLYAHKTRSTASKAIAAQYLAELLIVKGRGENWTTSNWEAVIPGYLVAAIHHVTRGNNA
jgi:putative ATP-dependent endonuclease of OLD family